MAQVSSYVLHASVFDHLLHRLNGLEVSKHVPGAPLAVGPMGQTKAATALGYSSLVIVLTSSDSVSRSEH